MSRVLLTKVYNEEKVKRKKLSRKGRGLEKKVMREQESGASGITVIYKIDIV